MNHNFSPEIFSIESNLQWNPSAGRKMVWKYNFGYHKNAASLYLCAMVHLHIYHLLCHRFGKCGLWITNSMLVSKLTHDLVEKNFERLSKKQFITIILPIRLKDAIRLEKPICIFNYGHHKLDDVIVWIDDWRIPYSSGIRNSSVCDCMVQINQREIIFCQPE